LGSQLRGRKKDSVETEYRPSFKPSGYQPKAPNLAPEVRQRILAVEDETITQGSRLILLRGCRRSSKGQNGFPEPKAWNTFPASKYSRAASLSSFYGDTSKLQKRMTVGKPTARPEKRFRRDRITRAYIRSPSG
jgi:hypothetical protein